MARTLLSLVEAQIINKNRTVRTLAYLDTGATYSVFHADFAEELGLDIFSGERKEITVGDGGMIPLYLFKLNLIIENDMKNLLFRQRG